MYLFRCLSRPSYSVHFSVCQFIDDTLECEDSPLSVSYLFFIVSGRDSIYVVILVLRYHFFIYVCALASHLCTIFIQNANYLV